MMSLPNRIFFTGVPGSRWSSVAQLIETVPGFNVSDRTAARIYRGQDFSYHLGAYFGPGMEFSPDLTEYNIDSAHTNLDGCRLIKSHEWSYHLDEIKQRYPHDWIIMVYRPDLISFASWNTAGGFDIAYPRYDAFKDATNMMSEISKMNQSIMEFSYKHDAVWNHLSPKWIKDTFGVVREAHSMFREMLITIIK